MIKIEPFMYEPEDNIEESHQKNETVSISVTPAAIKKVRAVVEKENEIFRQAIKELCSKIACTSLYAGQIPNICEGLNVPIEKLTELMNPKNSDTLSEEGKDVRKALYLKIAKDYNIKGIEVLK